MLICVNGNSGCPQNFLIIHILNSDQGALSTGCRSRASCSCHRWHKLMSLTFTVKGSAQLPVLPSFTSSSSHFPILLARSRLNSPAFVQGRCLPYETLGFCSQLDRTRGNGHILKYIKCHLNIRKHFLLPWWLNTAIGCPESLPLEVFKTWLDTGLTKLLKALFWAGQLD